MKSRKAPLGEPCVSDTTLAEAPKWDRLRHVTPSAQRVACAQLIAKKKIKIFKNKNHQKTLLLCVTKARTCIFGLDLAQQLHKVLLCCTTLWTLCCSGVAARNGRMGIGSGS